MGAGASIEGTNHILRVGLKINSIYDPPKLLVRKLIENDVKKILADQTNGDDISKLLHIQKLIKKEIGVVIPFYRLVYLSRSSLDGNYAKSLYNYLQLYTQSDNEFEKSKNFNYVNLAFLLVFAKEHSIPDDMKIFEVVEKIIKPLTLEAKASYVKSQLWRKHPQFHGEKQRHSLNRNVPKAHYSFVSLNWDMSFHELLMAVSAYPEEHYAQEGRFTSPVAADLGQCSYYYIDIFSDNLHEPKSMKEDMKKRLSDILDSESMVIPATMEENGNIGLCNQTFVDLVPFLSRIKEGDARSEFVPVYFSFNNEKEKVDKLLESIGFIGDVPEGATKEIIRRRTKEKSHQRIMELVNASGISFGSIEVEDALSKNRRKTFSKAELFEIFQELKYFGDKSICEEERLDQRLKRFLGNGLLYHCYRYYYPELYHCLNVYADHKWETATKSTETIIHRDWNISIDKRVIINSVEIVVPPFTAVVSALTYIIAVIEDIVFKRDEDPVVFDEGGPYGVSLEFLHDFIKRYNISDTMTTGEVVEKIIKPETADTKETYVKAKLWKKHPEYFLDLRQEIRELEFLKRYTRAAGNEELFLFDSSIFERYYVAFLSHAWLMPFVKLVEIAYQAPNTHFGNLTTSDVVASRSFYWIDIFCKNQHVPAPAMDEFYRAIEAPGRVVAAMWPSRPVALNRVWCLYELWTSLHRKIELVPTFPGDIFESLVASKDIQEESIERFNYQLLSVEAQTAQATYPADAEMILGMIRDSIGIDQFNGMIREAIFSFLHKRYYVLYVQQIPYSDGSCFSGEGKVLLGDRKNWKYVKDIKEGEKVITHEGIVAEIVLVTIDEIAKGELEMCEVGGVWLTPEHPVLVESGKKRRNCGDKWELPKNMVATQRRSIDRVYNFELSRGGNSVLINGLAVITLGNDKKLPGDDLYGSGWKRNPQRKKYADARGIQLPE